VRVIASVEIDKKCNEVLAQHFPDATQFDDVTTVKGSDLIGAGFNPSRVLLQEDFPVKTSALLAKELVLLAHEAGYSGKLQELWKKRKANTSSSKTYLVCYPVTREQILESSSGRWPTSGILSAGVCLMLNTSEYPSDAKESSSLGDVLLSEALPKYF
jgi:hypothetical protein